PHFTATLLKAQIETTIRIRKKCRTATIISFRCFLLSPLMMARTAALQPIAGRNFLRLRRSLMRLSGALLAD
ncbi:MAG: hypothetical protein ABN483_09285, partial [Pantoea agglomerans]